MNVDELFEKLDGFVKNDDADGLKSILTDTSPMELCEEDVEMCEGQTNVNPRTFLSLSEPNTGQLSCVASEAFGGGNLRVLAVIMSTFPDIECSVYAPSFLHLEVIDSASVNIMKTTSDTYEVNLFELYDVDDGGQLAVNAEKLKEIGSSLPLEDESLNKPVTSEYIEAFGSYGNIVPMDDPRLQQVVDQCGWRAEFDEFIGA